jgi:predicted nucleic-acid-binding protein
MSEKPKTPNLDKLIDNTATYNAIAQFLDWLTHDSDYHIAEYGEVELAYSRLWHTRKGAEEILYEYLELDPKIVDAERQSILEYIRDTHGDKQPPAMTMEVTIGDEKETI